MKKLSFLLFTVLLGLTTSAQTVDISYLQPKDYLIGGITVSGTETLDNTVLITISKLRVGDRIRIPGEKITQAIKDLWAQGLFDDVQINTVNIQGDTIFLDLYLAERPRLSKIQIKGLKKGETSTLNNKINTQTTGKIVNENLISTTRRLIANHFADKGFYDTKMDIVAINDTSSFNRKQLIATVDRGRKVKVQQIQISGNDELSDKTVKKFMKNTKERKFYKIFGAKRFKPSKFDEDLANIVSKYNEAGYRDAKVVMDTFYRNDEKTVKVDLKVDEGNKYYFGNINWVGNSRYPDSLLNLLIQIKKGDVFDPVRLDSRVSSSKTEDDISSVYLNNGYLFFRIDPVEVRVYNDTVDLEMRIFEGEQATINKVTIKGNERTNDRVVLREIRTKPGDKFNKSLIIRTIREIAQLGYFNEQATGVNPKPNPNDGTVDIEYTVEEKPSDQIELSGGFGGGRIIGTLGLSFNNFSIRKLFSKNWGGALPTGDGQKLSVRVQTNGKFFQNYNFSFTEPWLGGNKPRFFTVNLFTSGQSNALDVNNPNFFKLNTTGVTVSLGQRLKVPDDFFQYSGSLNLQKFKLQNFPGFVFPTGTSYTISLSQVLSRNSVDAPIFPKSGSNIQLSVQATPPYSLFSKKDFNDPNLSPQDKFRFNEFHKWKFDASWFINVGGDFVLNAKTQFGFLGLYNRDLGLTQFERFRLGGDGLAGFDFLQGSEVVGLRGYANNSVVPDGTNDTQTGNPIYSKYVLELRHPITLSDQASVFGLIFAEGGNTWNRFTEFSPFNVKRSVGVGVRIFLPIFGLLGLDYGYGFDRIPGNPDANKGQFHFSISQSLGGF